MTHLENLLSTISDLSDPVAVLAKITAKNRRIVVYEGLQTVGAYTRAYGDAATATLLYAIESAIAGLRATGTDQNKATAILIETYSEKFINSGLPLDDPQTQASLDILIPLIGQTLVDNLKGLGAYYVSECITAGIADPSLQEVTDAIAVVLGSRV